MNQTTFTFSMLAIGSGILLGLGLGRLLPPSSTGVAGHPTVNSIPGQVSPVSPPVAKASSVKRARTPWERLESTNYFHYIANLRRIECPEFTITDIILADLRAGLRKPGPKTRADLLAGILRGEEAAKNQAERMKARARDMQEIDRLAFEVFGLKRRPEPSGYFLTADHFQLIQEARHAYPKVPFSSSDPQSMELRRANLRQRLNWLAPLMDRDQFVAYKVVYEGFGSAISRALQGFRPTQQEFYAMVDCMEDESQTDLKEKFKTLLTPARLAEFEAFQDPDLKRGYSTLSAFNMSPPRINRILQLFQQRETLSKETFRAQLKQLVPDPDVFNLVLPRDDPRPSGAGVGLGGPR